LGSRVSKVFKIHGSGFICQTRRSQPPAVCNPARDLVVAKHPRRGLDPRTWGSRSNCVEVPSRDPAELSSLDPAELSSLAIYLTRAANPDANRSRSRGIRPGISAPMQSPSSAWHWCYRIKEAVPFPSLRDNRVRDVFNF